MRVSQGQAFDIDTRIPWQGAVLSDPSDSLLINRAGGSSISVTPARPGRTEVEVRLGEGRLSIPVRRLVVDVVPEMRVVPGGHSIGILLASNGVCVMGLYPVIGVDGGRYLPARDAGIRVGDVVLSVEGRPVADSADLEELVSSAARSRGQATVRIARAGREIDLQITPAQCEAGFRIGAYVRDNAAGVGTLTFWHAVSGRFGALGHVVLDAQTGKEVGITDGRIVSARVTGIESGGVGQPGEKIGAFAGARDNIGVVDSNTSVGIYGTLASGVDNPFYPEPIPVALASAVHEGPAEMLTVISGITIERFAVEIVKVSRQSRPGGRGLVIRVTDPLLVERTGGIVQGMSGSPLIQDGKLIGAVTHVFVSDPTRGYGVFAEYMLDAAGLLEKWGLTVERPIHGRIRHIILC